MAERLGHQQQRLSLEISDRAVRSSFEVSWAALDEDLQAVFPQLAVFEGRSFSTAAVAYIAELDQFDVEDQLFALEALSLVREEGADRWWQHPLLADFALEKLGEHPDAFERMVHYYYHFAEKHHSDYAELEAEWGNVTSAIEVAHRLQQRRLLIEFITLLEGTWLSRARYVEARRAFALARDAAVFLGDEISHAQLLVSWSEVCIEQNDYAEAEEHLQTSLMLASNQDDRAGCASARYHLARIAIEQNRYAVASEYLQQCLVIRQELGNQLELARVYYRQARLHYDYGPDLDTATQMANRALTIQHSVNDTLGMIRTLRTLSQIASTRADYEVAKEHGERARQLSEVLGDRVELAANLYVLSHVYLSLADQGTALAMAEQSLSLYDKVGNRRLQAMLLNQLTKIYIARGEYERAAQNSARGIELFQEVGDKLGVAYAMQNRGDVDLRMGHADSSIKLWQSAIQIAQDIGHQGLVRSLTDRLHQIGA